MRIPSLVSLVSLLAVVATVAACDLSSGRSCTEYDGCYPGSSGYGSSGYGSSGYGSSGYPGYDASPPTPACSESFSVAIAIPAHSGDCKLVLGGEYTSSSQQTAIYYFAEPAGDDAQPCEVLDGPTVGRCTREHDVVILASTRADQVAALRAQLGLDSDQTSFSAELSCARAVTPWKKTVVLRCASATPATPGIGDDAGADPDSGPADNDAGDASCDDAEAPPPLH